MDGDVPGWGSDEYFLNIKHTLLGRTRNLSTRVIRNTLLCKPYFSKSEILSRRSYGCKHTVKSSKICVLLLEDSQQLTSVGLKK